jgi:hypothetical protein
LREMVRSTLRILYLGAYELTFGSKSKTPQL